VGSSLVTVLDVRSTSWLTGILELTVLQRTPNLALPMQNWNLDPAAEQQKKEAGDYEKV